MTKKCLDCKATVIDDLESEMENEVPMWYKKAGNYSLLPKLLNCEDKFNPNKTELKEKLPDIGEIRVEVPVKVDDDDKKEGTWIFYWAALSNKELEINGPEAAYSDESNSGLVKSNKEGEATLVLNCPQPYRVDGITYPRHVHYTVLTEDNVWSFDVKTSVVYCHLDREQIEKALKSEDHIIINALSEEDHNKKSIPGSLNLPISTVNVSNRVEKINSFIEQNIRKYPDLEGLIERNKLDMKDVPIITYCANPGCNASKNLAKHIMNAGFSNVVEYPGGIEEWFKNEGEESSEEETFFEEDSKYNLDNQYETIIINGSKYKHKLDDLNYVFDDNDNKVGVLKKDEIEWDTIQDKENNEMLIETDEDTSEEEESDKKEEPDKKEDKKPDKKEDKKPDKKEEETSSSSDEEDTTTDEDDTSDEEDEENKKQKGGASDKKSLSYDGIYLCHGGNSEMITQKHYDTLFKGWGFTFL
jgi:rhodanese-related sulfurtransferase